MKSHHQRRSWQPTTGRLHPRDFLPEWLSKPVLIKKKNSKWRVCIDFSNLNETCPKDSFSLPLIELVETTTSHELLNFMDAYSGHNQIKMHPPNKDKTIFSWPEGLSP